MAYTSENVLITGRIVKVAYGTRGHGTPGETQTVNVCDRNNHEGNYEQVYRIRGSEHFITVQEICRNAPSLQALDAFLVQHGAAREGPRATK
jgi:hypothetical protein